MVLQTSVLLIHLTRLIAREKALSNQCINFHRCKNTVQILTNLRPHDVLLVAISSAALPLPWYQSGDSTPVKWCKHLAARSDSSVFVREERQDTKTYGTVYLRRKQKSSPVV
jgi:hypothetical protein